MARRVVKMGKPIFHELHPKGETIQYYYYRYSLASPPSAQRQLRSLGVPGLILRRRVQPGVSLADFRRRALAALPDTEIDVLHLVAAHLRLRGTHRGILRGVPSTGRAKSRSGGGCSTGTPSTGRWASPRCRPAEQGDGVARHSTPA